MLYDILRPTTRWVIRGYYRKVFVNGMENIPKDKPVLLAVNHPSAFTEPCILATHLERELHFLVRGDVVSDKLRWFFTETNQLPIYRFRDGFSNMRQNEKQFSYCFDLLEKNGCIVLFCEGSTQHIKRTRSIQKGIAKIAFGALESRDLDEVYIVPIGVNFESSPQPRSVVTIQIGEAISARKYFVDSDGGEDRSSIREMTTEIGHKLFDQMVNIKQDERLQVADDLLYYRANSIPFSLWPVRQRNSNTFFEALDHLGHTISDLSDETFQEVSKMNTDYQQVLKKSKLDDLLFRPYRSPFLVYLLLILGLPLAFMGGLLLLIPHIISFGVQKKLNKSAEYISGFRMAGFILFIPIFTILITVLMYSYCGVISLVLLTLIPLLIRFAVIWYDRLVEVSQKLKFAVLSKPKQEKVLELRNRIFEKLNIKF